MKYNVVTKRGAWFDIVDIETGEVLEGNIQGQANVIEFLENENNVAVLQRVENLIDAKMQEA